MKRLVSLLFSALILGGCVSVPESVQLPEDTNLLPYESLVVGPMLEESANAKKNQMARWGGVVANVENQQDRTMLDIVYYPLRAYGRPILRKESIGRFRVYVNGFLDPMVYQKGRSMTFAGTLTGTETGLVGEHNYVYPTLEASGYFLWEDIDRIEIETISVWPGYGHPWGVRGFYGWRLWPYHQRHIVTRKHQHYQSGDHSSGSNTKATTNSNNSNATSRSHSSNRNRMTQQNGRKEQ